MTNKMGTQSPKGSVCAKCGEEIPAGMGRRYRMKWMHEHCLPPTRLARINHYREVAMVALGVARVENDAMRAFYSGRYCPVLGANCTLEKCVFWQETISQPIRTLRGDGMFCINFARCTLKRCE